MSQNPLPRYYFSTRDLLMMAALAALGGVSSTAVNALGDAVQAALGFAGTTQWAAGIHVLWLVLAVGLTRKSGAGTVTGLLKGAVELLSGNTHGLLVLLIDLAAGLLVDFAVLPFRRKDALLPLMLAGGLASASNVFVFQLFAAAPEDVLRYIWALAALAFGSGVVLAGLLGFSLLQALRRAGVVKDQPAAAVSRLGYALFFAVMIVVAGGLGLYVSAMLKGAPAVEIVGEVDAPYRYEADKSAIRARQMELEINGMTRQFTGVPLRDVLALAHPRPNAASALVTATDGYSFFISMREIGENEQLILAQRGKGDDLSYEIAGAENQKAWVRGLKEIRLVGAAQVEWRGLSAQPVIYDPDEWQLQMDNGSLDLGDGAKKYQGVALSKLLARWTPPPGATTLLLIARDGQTGELTLAEALADANWRIWNLNTTSGIRFVIAHADGRVLLQDVVVVEVK